MNTGHHRGRASGRALPPLDYLLAFEASALEAGFAGASRRLNVSETAISRKVRLLEQHFGLAFFRRGTRSVVLTDHGRDFLARVRPALDAIRDAAADTMDLGRNLPVVLAATNSVASLWLSPRLHGFRQDNPHLRIMLVASDNDAECLAEEVDLAILRGDGRWPGFAARMVFGETVFPVCSPGFLNEHPEVADIGNLPQAPLIEVVSAHTEWMDWRAWLGHNGIGRVDLDRTTLFNTYAPAIQAAIDGVGVALGWAHLVDPMLASGRLVRPLGDRQVATSHGYFLLTPEGRIPSAACQEVAHWLRQSSSPAPGGPGPQATIDRPRRAYSATSSGTALAAPEIRRRSSRGLIPNRSA